MEAGARTLRFIAAVGTASVELNGRVSASLLFNTDPRCRTKNSDLSNPAFALQYFETARFASVEDRWLDSNPVGIIV